MVIASLVLLIKIGIFPMPIYLLYEGYQERVQGEATRKEMIGKWQGHYYYREELKRHYMGTLNIEIDSDSIFFDKAKGLAKAYQFKLRSPEYGIIIRKGEEAGYGIDIDKFENDTLVLSLDYFGSKYKFEMEKET